MPAAYNITGTVCIDQPIGRNGTTRIAKYQL